MNQHCLVCGRYSADGNLFCEQPYCPGERSPWLLEPGEHLADIEIVRLLTVLRSAALYAGLRQGEPLLVKVAHQGERHKERLKREATLLAVAQAKTVTAPFLPTLLPPRAAAGDQESVYARTGLDGKLLYYTTFAHVEAEALRDLLAKQPQLWINHAGWIAEQLATAVGYLHRRGVFHYNLCPEGVLVSFGKQPPHPPHVLLVDLGLCVAKDELPAEWYPDFLMPAYAAPELIDDRYALPKKSGSPVAADVRTDVYGLGLVLYELLVGQPPFATTLRSDQAIYADVVQGLRAPMDRQEDESAAAELAVAAASTRLAGRPADAASFAQPLLKRYGPTPEEKKRKGPTPRTLLLVAAALVAVALLITLAVSLVRFSS